MDELDKYLRQLVAQACAAPPGSVERQQILQEIHQRVMRSGRLWQKEKSKPYYADALQDMWEYCFQHLDEYDPQINEFITWLNDRFGNNLRSYGDRTYRQRNRQAPLFQTEDGQIVHPIDGLVAPPDIQPVLEIWNAILAWVESDPEGILHNTCFKNRPEINAQVLLLQQLSPQKVSWDTIAARFNLSPKDARYLPQWYSRHCNRLLRQFGKDRGYID
ncbi:MAG: sigma-70 family RNA polymerase sigma factor [Nostocaceae cyanobacterium]|nr:sigma-70 family RNA polymerase sigma factor [Nostocaceae cyanobacterium]